MGKGKTGPSGEGGAPSDVRKEAERILDWANDRETAGEKKKGGRRTGWSYFKDRTGAEQQLRQIYNQVREGTIDPTQGNALVGCLRTFIDSRKFTEQMGRAPEGERPGSADPGARGGARGAPDEGRDDRDLAHG